MSGLARRNWRQKVQRATCGMGQAIVSSGSVVSIRTWTFTSQLRKRVWLLNSLNFQGSILVLQVSTCWSTCWSVTSTHRIMLGFVLWEGILDSCSVHLFAIWSICLELNSDLSTLVSTFWSLDLSVPAEFETCWCSNRSCCIVSGSFSLFRVGLGNVLKGLVWCF